MVLGKDDIKEKSSLLRVICVSLGVTHLLRALVQGNQNVLASCLEFKSRPAGWPPLEFFCVQVILVEQSIQKIVTPYFNRPSPLCRSLVRQC